MMHYSKTLTPEQVPDMHEFLLNLKNVNKAAIELGLKIDVGEFINIWAGRHLKGEDKINADIWRARGIAKLKKVSHG